MHEGEGTIMDKGVVAVVQAAIEQGMSEGEAAMLRGLRERIENGAMQEQASLIARAHMIRYRAYQKAGFDDQQALILACR